MCSGSYIICDVTFGALLNSNILSIDGVDGSLVETKTEVKMAVVYQLFNFFYILKD